MCCVNQSSIDDYFIVACGARGCMLCSILVMNVRGITILVENVWGDAEACTLKLYKNVSGI